MKNDEDIFMAQFNQRLSLEPAPSWTQKKRSFPWLDLGWAAAAALMLGLYWSELHFGFAIVYSSVIHLVARIPTAWTYTMLAMMFIAGTWAAPQVVREL